MTMQDIMHGFQIGDRVIFDDQDDELGLEKGDEGVILDFSGNASFIVNFNGKHTEVKWFWLKPWVDVASLNPRQKIKHDYAEWVDEISDTCDWVTSISMDEVQSKYSGLAIKLAITELESILEVTTDSATSVKLHDRISYLNSLL